MSEIKLDQIGTLYEDKLRPITQSSTYRISALLRKEGSVDPIISIGVTVSGAQVSFEPVLLNQNPIVNTEYPANPIAVEFSLSDLPTGATDVMLTVQMHNEGAVCLMDTLSIVDVSSEATSRIYREEAVNASITATQALSDVAVIQGLVAQSELGAASSAQAAQQQATVATTQATAAANSASVSDTNRLQAQSFRDSAEAAASASATSAQTASTRATEAETAAASSETSRLASETASSSAATSAGNATLAYENADESASTAATSASLATAAQTNAENAALASSSSASAASTSATEAEQFAQASETARLAATTAQGLAESARDASVASATAADGHRAAAASSASVAAQSELDAENFANASSTSAQAASSFATTAGAAATASSNDAVAASNAAGAAETARVATVAALDDTIIARDATSVLATNVADDVNGLTAQVNTVSTAQTDINDALATYRLAVMAGNRLAGFAVRAADGSYSVDSSFEIFADVFKHTTLGTTLFESLATGSRVATRLIIGELTDTTITIIDNGMGGDTGLNIWVGSPADINNPTRTNAVSYWANNEIKIGGNILRSDGSATIGDIVVDTGGGVTIGGVDPTTTGTTIGAGDTNDTSDTPSVEFEMPTYSGGDVRVKGFYFWNGFYPTFGNAPANSYTNTVAIDLAVDQGGGYGNWFQQAVKTLTVDNTWVLTAEGGPAPDEYEVTEKASMPFFHTITGNNSYLKVKIRVRLLTNNTGVSTNSSFRTQSLDAEAIEL